MEELPILKPLPRKIALSEGGGGEKGIQSTVQSKNRGGVSGLYGDSKKRGRREMP